MEVRDHIDPLGLDMSPCAMCNTEAGNRRYTWEELVRTQMEEELLGKIFVHHEQIRNV